MSPKVSVLLPVYNASRYLKSSVQSILDQTFTDFECIIINDGSSDNSAEILKTFSDKRLVIKHHDKNYGIVACLNEGLENANGEYIARMDADDVSLPERITEQVNCLNDHPETGVCTVDYNIIRNGLVSKSNTWFESRDLLTLLLFNSPVCHPASMFRKSVLNKSNIKYYNTFKHAEDYHFWVQLSSQTQFCIIKKKLFLYRIHDKQISEIKKKEQQESGNNIRGLMLKNWRIRFEKADLEIHNKIGNNVRLGTKSELIQAKNWLEKLVLQNGQDNLFPVFEFNRVIGKMWLDICGNTSIGLVSFLEFQNSKLTQYFPIKFGAKLMLMLKCLMRIKF